MFSMQNLNHSIISQVNNIFTILHLFTTFLIFTNNNPTASCIISFIKPNASSQQSLHKAREAQR